MIETERRPPYEDEIDLWAVMDTLWRYKYLIGMLLIVSVLAAAAFTLSKPATYTSEVYLFVGSFTNGSTERPTTVLPFDTFATLAYSDPITRVVSERVSMDLEQIHEATDVRAHSGSRILTFSAMSADPKVAFAVAQAWHGAYVSYVQSVASQLGASEHGSRLVVVNEPRVATEPEPSRLLRALATTAMLSLFVGCLAAFAIESRKQRRKG